jgi:hypothetical protein
MYCCSCGDVKVVVVVRNGDGDILVEIALF